MGEVDLDAEAVTWRDETVSFRFAILHMIEETGYLPDDGPC
jgi:hypothetical protein